jgi:DNA repair protein RadC
MSNSDQIHGGHRLRLFEKFLKFGPDIFSDHELLEILLFEAVKRQNTNFIAHDLIDAFGGIDKVFEAKPDQLCSVKGVGKAVATYISSIGRIMKRIENCKTKDIRITNLSEAEKYFAPRLNGEQEKLIASFLRKDGKLISSVTFGSSDEGMVAFSTKELNKQITLNDPAAIIIAHNHPSGNVTPSLKDDEAVKSIYYVCRINGVKLNDCLIFANGNMFSYYVSGRFEKLEAIRKECENDVEKRNAVDMMMAVLRNYDPKREYVSKEADAGAPAEVTEAKTEAPAAEEKAKAPVKVEKAPAEAKKADDKKPAAQPAKAK